jgi:hypothetical protein
MDATTNSTLHKPSFFTWARAGGMLFGFGNQLLFAITVWYLFWFLRDGSLNTQHSHWVEIDLLLAVIFAVSHSLLLAPFMRKRLKSLIPSAFYESFFSATTCFSLLLLFCFWRTSEYSLWNLQNGPLFAIRLFFYASWAALLYSLALTGLGYQNGWTTFYYWLVQRSPPKREFVTQGAYKYLRHPVYLSFLGLIWFTPNMSLDHALLTGVWTGYIFIGSILKDQRLYRFIGKPYRDYATQVPGYPLCPIGPLARTDLADRKTASGLTSTDRASASTLTPVKLPR